MPAIANIVIADGESTPVTHTFVPVQSTPYPFWRDTLANVALVAQPSIDMKSKREKNGMTKIILTLSIPASEVVVGQNAAGYSAAPKIAYTNKVVMTFFLPERGTDQQRKNLRVLANAVLGTALTQVSAAIDQVQMPY